MTEKGNKVLLKRFHSLEKVLNDAYVNPRSRSGSTLDPTDWNFIHAVDVGNYQNVRNLIEVWSNDP